MEQFKLGRLILFFVDVHRVSAISMRQQIPASTSSLLYGSERILAARARVAAKCKVRVTTQQFMYNHYNRCFSIK